MCHNILLPSKVVNEWGNIPLFGALLKYILGALDSALGHPTNVYMKLKKIEFVLCR